MALQTVAEFDVRAMDLVNAVRRIFEADITRGSPIAEQLGRALELMTKLRPDQDRAGANELPVCRHLPRALDIGAAGPATDVAMALRDLAPSLVWNQNPRYNAENMGADFMDNYGWSGLGLTGDEAMSFGALMLGPATTYPPTSYESEGVFLVVAGSPQWKSGDDPWRTVVDGSIIGRPWGGTEGKRTGDEPMFALYAWMYSQP